MSGAVTSVVVAVAVSETVAAVVGAEILGSTLLASAATGAITGAIGSAAGSLVSGGDVGEAIISGALGGAVGGVAGSAAQAAGASPQVARAASQFAGGTTRGLVSGRDFGEAIKGGAIAGGLSYVGDELFGAPAKTSDPLAKQALSSIERMGLNTAVSSLFAPSRGGVGATSFSPTATATNTTAGVGSAPSTQALSQALRTGDPGAPLFGSEGKEGKRQNVWNVASLKVKDETGS